jgi:transposase
LLELAKMLAERNAAQTGTSHEAPATPSGMKPPYSKPTARGRKKKPGRKPGHPDTRRPPPERIDKRETHRAEVCPECGGPLCRCAETRTRYTEDIPEVQPEVTEHTIHRDWCLKCRKKVERKLYREASAR